MAFGTGLLSSLTGVPEPTLRLLLTVVLAYPAAFIYNDKKPANKEQRTKLLLTLGSALNIFFNGFNVIHTIVTVGVSYALCLVVGEGMQDRRLATRGVWIFNALYLLLGYYFMQTDDYDITWTMTQCILCLRMMGFGFDYYDGRVPNAVVESKGRLPLSFGSDTPLQQLPGLEELFAYAMFPSAFLVGPQFSYSLFNKWISNTEVNQMTDEQKEERSRAQSVYVFRCAALALLYLGLQQTVGAMYSTSYLLTEEYQSMSLLKRMVIFAVAGKFAYNKYIGIWLLTEGATAYFGISYEGVDSEGLALFGGLANALPLQYELSTSIDQMIGAFNINTNLWSKYYVFKRLKFLNNKRLSQFGTLFFLAIWHGFHAMYFITFALEFLYMQCELVLRKRLSPMVQPYTKQNEIAYYVWKAVSWLTCQLCITYAVVGFELLSLKKAYIAYKSVGFIGHFAIVVILGANKYLPRPVAPSNKKKQ